MIEDIAGSDSTRMGAAPEKTFSSAMEHATRYTEWVVGEFTPFLGRSVIEIGIGHGGYHDALPRGIDYRGVDIDPALVDRARRLRPGVEYAVADITHERWASGMRTADSVLCINVLEHIMDDEAALRYLMTPLEPRGHLLLLVPALEFLYNDLDRLAGHHRRYTKDVLRRRLSQCGADIIRLEYFNPVGAIGWWANRFTRHASLEASRVRTQVQVFDRYVLPVSRGLNSVTRNFFGQSLLAVVRRA